MVFYTCSGCGESLKKNKVEKHVNVCRNCEYLTCIDCSKDFWGDDYKTHTSCISEEEKYAATGFKAKPNKGEVKQQEWLKKIEKAKKECSSLSTEAKDLLERMEDYGNVPRKKGKFLNFLSNSLKIRNKKLTEEVWEIFSSMNKPKDNNACNPDQTLEPCNKKKDADKENEEYNGASMKKEKIFTKTKKKRKQDDEEEEQGPKKKRKTKIEACNVAHNDARGSDKTSETNEGEGEGAAAARKFPWFRTIKVCLKTAPDHELSIKKLRKKVLKEYSCFDGEKRTRTENELNALFLKKVNRNPKFRVLKEKVKLL
ncbi:cell growth-regulating nucleolar protein-like isoform X2 [Clavelina lepadiformis]|uniref:cell growth-regulating nucleolar protein-like isoform X2 n=1 Tax=Clavelina lepadiformis TaxID=159417 RepID=UPI0040425CC2